MLKYWDLTFSSTYAIDHQSKMDPLDTLPVRFHLGDEFLSSGRNVYYVGGSEEMSYLERDKVSLPEIVGHLQDHCAVQEGTLLHWLFPGKDLNNGLRVLVDDATCLEMSNCISEGGVVEIYVEDPAVVQSSDGDQDEDGSEYEEEEINASGDSPSENAPQIDEGAKSPIRIGTVETREEIQKQIDFVKSWYSPTKSSGGGKGKKVLVSSHYDDVDAYSSDSDSDFLPGDECSSGDDEEVKQINEKLLREHNYIKEEEGNPKFHFKGTVSCHQEDVVLICKGKCANYRAKEVQLNLNANVPLSQASNSVSINLTGGNAEGSVSSKAQVKRAKLPPRRRATQEPQFLLLGPSDS
ncbi:hypothetical protein BS78_03G164600 [Paspalum vaginatum]|nr:hypothetical protein BS78_03G164600 [Paspalum vaginatum]